MISTDVRIGRSLEDAFQRLSDTSMKLATVKRIRTARDDPAGLIAFQELNRELLAAEESAAAANRSRAVVHVADFGLSHAGSLLAEIEGHLVAAADGATSDEQRAALQLEVDAALDALDRTGETRFAGRRLFSGEPLQFLTGTAPFQTASLRLPELESGTLGGETGRLSDLRTGGGAALDGDLTLAGEILGAAQSEIRSARVRAGSFERTSIDRNRSVLQATAVSLRQGMSGLMDADVAHESARLAQSMILAETSIAAAQFTNFARHTAAGLLDSLSVR